MLGVLKCFATAHENIDLQMTFCGEFLDGLFLVLNISMLQEQIQTRSHLFSPFSFTRES